MKKYIFLIMSLFVMKAHACHHHWSDLPDEGQLYMCLCSVSEEPYNPGGHKVNIRVIRRYDSWGGKYDTYENGWWDVNKEDLWDWMNSDCLLIHMTSDIPF